MDAINKGNNMSIEEKKVVVKQGVSAYAKAELACQTMTEAFTELDAIYKDAATSGLIPGGQVVKELALFKKLIGKVGDIEEAIYAAHRRGTSYAKKAGADIEEELPGDFVVLGGGGRP